MKIKVRYLILASIIAFLAIFFLGGYLGHRRGVNASEVNIRALNDSISSYIVKINGDSVYISQKEQEILSQKEALKRGDIERAELRALNIKHVNEISRLKLQVDTLLENITHNGTIIVVSQEKSDSLANDTINVKQNAILLPFDFEKKDDYLTLKGNFNNQGLLDISLKMDVPIDLWSGYDKKTKTPTFVTTTTNKYIQTLSINSIKMDTQKPKRYGIGFQIGYGISFGDPIKTAPYFGAGLSYNLIRF